MNSESKQESKPEAMSQSTKDRYDVGSKVAAIVVGIFSVIGLIVTLRDSTQQRATELRWNQAKLAKELLDGMLADSQAFDALRMIDWNGREYTMKDGQKVRIYYEDVWNAIDLGNTQLTDKDIHIRDCFDGLFYHMAGMARSVRTNLIKLDDVRYPLEYYITRMSDHRELVKEYMKEFGSRDAIDLLDKLSTASASDPEKKSPN